MKMIHRILAVMKKEFLLFTRDKIMFLIAFVAPVGLTILMGFLYIHHTVTQIPIVVWDRDQTEISRTVIRAFGDSEKFKIIEAADSFEKVKDDIDAEKAYMGVVIPPDLKESIKEGRGSQIGIILNGSNLLIMNVAGTAANTVIATLSGGITMKVMEGYGISSKKAYQAVTALSFRTRYWYNPTNCYVIFMLLGLIGTILQQITFLGVALSFAKEKDDHTIKNLLLSKLKWWELIIGKFFTYFIIFTIDALVMYSMGIFCFGIPLRGDPLLVVAITLLFILVLVAIGMAISILAPSAPQAIEISMMIAVPSFLISGYTWPTMSMPVVIQFLSSILPLTHFLKALRSIVLLGNGWRVVEPGILILSLFAIVCLPITLYAVKRMWARSN